MLDDYDYQERAAILEYEAGLSRLAAEESARKQLSAYRSLDHRVIGSLDSASGETVNAIAHQAPPDDGKPRHPPGRRDSGTSDKNTQKTYAEVAARMGSGYQAFLTEFERLKTTKGATNHG